MEKIIFLFAGMGSWYMNHTARGMLNKGAISGYWVGDKCQDDALRPFYKRIWLYHLFHKPFCHAMYSTRLIDLEERSRWWALPAYDVWMRLQKLPAGTSVVQAPMGSCQALFDIADKAKQPILKVFDAPNSHPRNLQTVWQRECDSFLPGYKIPIPSWAFLRMAREIERADLVLCPSTAVKESMVHYGVPEKKCFVSHFGVDTHIFRPRTELPDVPTFICVGSICLRKGHQYLFPAWVQAKTSLPKGSRLICVGGVRPDFEQEWKKWGGTFEHYLSLSHYELAKVMRASTAFVFPSLEEGFARVLSEALASGLPIIATHESGATTVVEDGIHGVIVKPRDVESLAAAMIELASNQEKNKFMSLNACRVGQEGNTWQDYSDRLFTEVQNRLA